MQHYLLKTEPSTFSIDDLKREGVTSWGGVRNYQARNILREMKVGDQCFIYHSSCEVPAIVGVGEVVGEAYPDPLQFDHKSEYFDPASPIGTPRWSAVDIQYVRHFDRAVSLVELKRESSLRGMRLLQKGNRLSVVSVTDSEMKTILALEQAFELGTR
jgi:predicted RNA-binding protein with PUA-like domain